MVQFFLKKGVQYVCGGVCAFVCFGGEGFSKNGETCKKKLKGVIYLIEGILKQINPQEALTQGCPALMKSLTN